jgi:hypothetical protein
VSPSVPLSPTVVPVSPSVPLPPYCSICVSFSTASPYCSICVSFITDSPYCSNCVSFSTASPYCSICVSFSTASPYCSICVSFSAASPCCSICVSFSTASFYSGNTSPRLSTTAQKAIASFAKDRSSSHNKGSATHWMEGLERPLYRSRALRVSFVLVIVAMGWDYVSVALGSQRACCPSPRRYMSEYGAPVEWYWQGKTEELIEKLVPSHLSTTNPTWTDMGANPGLRCEKPATNRLSCGTVRRFLISFSNINWISKLKTEFEN